MADSKASNIVLIARHTQRGIEKPSDATDDYVRPSETGFADSDAYIIILHYMILVPVLLFTLQLRPPAARRAAKAAACLPVAAVKPSGFTSVFPSMGAAPSFATAK